MNARIRTFGFTVLGVALLLPAHLIQAADRPPEVSHDGLHLVHGSRLDLVYLKPGADFSAFDRIALLEPEVAFRKNWQRDHNRADPFAVTKGDMDRIRERLSAMLLEVFRDELVAKGGYEESEYVAPDVLILRPAIVNLDITAPASAELRGRTVATSAGEMTLYMEVFDSSTREILARIADRQAGRNHGVMMWQNSVTNRAEAERVVRGWAATLRAGLDTLRSGAVAPVP